MRAERLQAADGVAVVAELGVVVVFEHQPVHLGGPRDQLSPPSGRQDDPGRILVRGGDDDGPGGAAPQGVDVDALAVDRDRYPDSAGSLQQRRGADAMGVLDGQPDRARLGERTDDEVQRLGDAAGDDEPIGGDVGRADPAEVGRQLRSQLGDAAGVAVPQHLVWRHLHDLAHGGKPRSAREGRQVRRARPQVVGDVARRRCAMDGAGVAGGLRGLEVRDPGTRALPGHQEALGHQLFIGLDDHAATHAEIASKLPAGRQAAAPGQPARPDGRAQLRGDPIGEAAGCSVDPQV